jgi:hypothetical protein
VEQAMQKLAVGVNGQPPFDIPPNVVKDSEQNPRV